MQNRVHTIRLFPDKMQTNELFAMMKLRNQLWNKLILIRNDYYEQNKKNMSDFDLINQIPTLKEKYPELKNFNSKAAQVVARQIGSSFRSFFALKKSGDNKAKAPQIIPEDKCVSITYNQSGWKFKENSKVVFNKISSPIVYASKNPIHKCKFKEVRIKYLNGKWLCDVVEEINDKYSENISQKVLAIDLGLKHLGTGIDNFGNVIFITNKAKKISKYFEKQIAKVSSKIDKKHKGSKRQRRLFKIRRKLYLRKNAQVKQTLHIQSKNIVNMNYHTVILGDLSVKELMSVENNNKKNVRKSFHQSSIDTFRTFLSYKMFGKTNVIEIDERNTTQINCLTGKKFDQKIELKDRVVPITNKITIDRDLNSAINLLKRYESYHLAALTPPLTKEILLNVLEKNNLFERA